MEQPLSLSKILDDVSKLVAFPDIKYRHKENTHEHMMKRRYGISNAYEETVLGYPYIRLAIQTVREIDSDSGVQRQMYMLLVLMNSLDDTHVLHRNDQKTLVEMQELAHTTSQSALPNHSFIALLHFCQESQTSPGGGADLLSTSLFMLKIEGIWTASTYTCPMPFNN